MPLADQDPNGSGRTSRASAMSIGSYRPPQVGTAPDAKNDLLTSTPAVQSMLRTSTEMGNIGGIALDPWGNNPWGNSSIPRPSRRTGATSRLSTTSSRSNASNRTTNQRAWPSSASSGQRGSRDPNVPQYVPDTLSPTVMNIPGSSDLIPPARARDSYRSHSMTMAANVPEPTIGLSANRSYGNLRTQEPSYGSRSPQGPYRYPARLRRPSHRPASPAANDNAGTHPRNYGYGGKMPPHQIPQHPGQARLRAPVDTSMRRDERGLVGGGPPRRARTPMAQVHLGDSQPGIPPVPPLPAQYQLSGQQSQRSGRSTKTSISSTSVNQRTDSDGPSSEATFPPTPKNDASMEVLVSPTGTQVRIGTMPGVVEEEMASHTPYLGYTEQYEMVESYSRDPFKLVLEQRGQTESVPEKNHVSVEYALGVRAAEVPDAVELPASPVPHRITRDWVQKELNSGSTTSDIEVTVSSEAATNRSVAGGNEIQEQATKDGLHRTPALDAEVERADKNRLSILSQAGSSVMDSSTLNFAVQYSIPIVTGNRIEGQSENYTHALNGLEANAATEDCMSDLLEGYQDTMTKREIEAQAERVAARDGAPERKSSHALKSSDAQSFKSCTDLPDSTESESKSAETASPISGDLPQPAAPFKDSDARSFKTCKDTITPERPLYMPPWKATRTNPTVGETKVENIDFSNPVSRASAAYGAPVPASSSEPAISKAAQIGEVSSELCAQHESAAPSAPLMTGSGTQHPLSVPPRGSSSSLEAMRTRLAGGFLLGVERGVRSWRKPKSIPMVIPNRLRSPIDDEEPVAADMQVVDDLIPASLALRERPLSANAHHVGAELVSLQPLEQESSKQEVSQGIEDSTSALAEKTSLSSKDTSTIPVTKQIPLVHQHSLSTPSPVIQDPSSVYTPDNISSAESSIHSLPIALSKTPEASHRDSQTTTHLNWCGGHSLQPPEAKSGVMHVIRDGDGRRDDTTTDLKLSSYRHRMHRLEDVQEDSHEDSSLNTSASNLKHSAFRFPGGGQHVPRGSVEEAQMVAGNMSITSQRKSTLSQAHALPSMNFSQVNLLEQLKDVLETESRRSADRLSDNEVRSSQSKQRAAKELQIKCQSLIADLDRIKSSGDGTRPDSEESKRKTSLRIEQLIKEIENLDVPDTEELTERLSVYIPGLRAYALAMEAGEFAEEEVIEKRALAQINEVAPTTKRSSARLRPMPGSPQLQVVDDAVYQELTSKGDAVGSSNGGAQSTEKESGENGVAKGRSWSVAHPHTRDKSPTAELEPPSPAILRTRSLSFGVNNLGASQESRPSPSQSTPSLVNTPTATDTRPWNSDKNYPWVASNPSVDISLPQAIALRQSPRPGLSRLRYRLSEAPSTPATSATPTLDSACPRTNMCRQGHGQDHLANDLILSSCNTGGYASAHVHAAGENQSHSTGERYPTSALPLPNLPPFLGVSPSQYSLTVSDEEPQASSSRKTRFHLRTRRNTKSFQGEAGAGRVQEDSATSQAKAKRQTFADAQGMPATVYHRLRLTDKIKTWWHKTGLFLRHLGRRSRTATGKQQQQAAPADVAEKLPSVSNS